MNEENILRKLPYSEPFLFVDRLEEFTESGIKGSYTFSEAAFFYRGHFRESPVTPGVILTECMAQIGVVCLGILLIGEEKDYRIAMSSTNVEFFVPVYPGEEVRVVSEKVYFRFGKLKCKVRMFNIDGKLVSKGEISGMIIQ